MYWRGIGYTYLQLQQIMSNSFLNRGCQLSMRVPVAPHPMLYLVMSDVFIFSSLFNVYWRIQFIFLCLIMRLSIFYYVYWSLGYPLLCSTCSSLLLISLQSFYFLIYRSPLFQIKVLGLLSELQMSFLTLRLALSSSFKFNQIYQLLLLYAQCFVCLL